MFNFMKKGDEKEKRKKEKDKKGKRDKDGGSSDETARFDDMRRSLKIRRRKEKLPSGITADYRENLFAEFSREADENKTASLPGYASRSDSSETSVNSLPQASTKAFPPLPPQPPKRGILKGAKSVSNDLYNGQDISNPMLLVKNTLQNEVIAYQNTEKFASNSLLLSTNNENLLAVASSAESLTDTTNSSFATPPLLSPTDHPPLPNLIPLPLPHPRNLSIYRTARGDFGFQLRRAVVTDKLSGMVRKEVLFAEPGSLGGHISDTGLLPGDVLLEVNSNPVHDVSREDIIGMIKSSGAAVNVKVQPIAELCEVTSRCRTCADPKELAVGEDEVDHVVVTGGTLKRSASQRFKRQKGRTDEELAKEKEWLDTERSWLIHRSGFSAARAIKKSSPTNTGKVKVQLENSEEILEVQEEDLERANPPKLDFVENLTELRYVNESSVLHTLRQRYGNNLIHTYAADALVVINPECPLSIYSEKVASLFLGCDVGDMPPHIYATAQTAYRTMVLTRRDQSIVLLGRSGSGKTHNFKHLLSYVLMASGSPNKIVTMERLNALNIVLEAFGNAKTLQNANATRCTNLISLDFDTTRQLASATLQMVMLEKSRITRRPTGEATFHVLYYLLAGAEGQLSKQLFLDAITASDNAFFSPVTKNDERQMCQMEFSKLSLAFGTLGATEKETCVIWSVLAAIYHLGYSGVVQVGTSKWQFQDPISASRASRLLGCTSEELAATLWDPPLSPARAAASPGLSHKELHGADSLEGFVQGLYSELVSVINAIINRCLSANVNTTASLVIVDAAGLQCPGAPATFPDLCHNYVQERLHLLFHNASLLAPLDRYTQDRVDVKVDELYTEQVSPSQLVAILDKAPPGGVLKTSQTDLREADRRGILWLTEEEIVYPNSSDDTLLQHILQQYGTKEFTPYIRRWSGTGQLCIQHLQGNSPVVYNVRGWLKSCREPRSARAALTLLQESSREDVSEMFVVGRLGGGMYAPEGGSQSLRRVSSIRRTCSAAVKRKSIGLQVKHTTDSIIETLRRTRARFVLCFSPQQWSGLSESCSHSPVSALVNIPLLRTQVRGGEVVAVVRLFKQGYPDYVPHSEFVRRFRLLAGGDATPILPIDTTLPAPARPMVTVTSANGVGVSNADEMRLVAEILYRAEIEEAAYKIGLSQVFFRSGVLHQLEAQRDEKLSGVIVGLQTRCRGYLARKKLVKLRVQDTAVRCIQRNVRKLMQVREWPWWKLFVRISPLLHVHSHEDKLKDTLREIETLKTRLEKLDSDHTALRLDKDRLQDKLNEMTADLTEERLAGAQATERLEAETSERIRLEQDLLQLNLHKTRLEDETNRLEIALHYAKGTENGISDLDDIMEGRDNLDSYKMKNDRLKREIEHLRQQLHRQHQDDLEQLVGLKKQLEKRLADANEEIDEQRKVVLEWKKKTQKLHDELADTRIVLEQEYSRNASLEKKQRRFDMDLQALEKAVREEKSVKERISRERDSAVGAKIILEQTLSSVKLDLQQKVEQVSSLNQELEDLTVVSATEAEVTMLKKSKHDLEKKNKELVAELDDLTGQLSMAESAKLKSDLALENIRFKHRKEQRDKEEELDEVKRDLQKKLQAAEMVIDSERELRANLARERNELMRSVSELEENERSLRSKMEETIFSFKGDLKKTKTLLSDAQEMLELAKQDHPSREALKTLKNQLEDTEVARDAAIKAKLRIMSELAEANSQLEEMTQLKRESEKKALAATRSLDNVKTQLEDTEEELSELTKKFFEKIQSDEKRAKDDQQAIAEAEADREFLRQQVATLSAKLEALEHVEPTVDPNIRRLEMALQDQKSRSEYGETVRKRLESQVSRLKEKIKDLEEQQQEIRKELTSSSENERKLQASINQLKDEVAHHKLREEELRIQKKDVEAKLEAAEKEAQAARVEARLSEQRVQRMQAALTESLTLSDADPSSDDD